MKVEKTTQGKDGFMDADWATKNCTDPLNMILAMTVTPDNIAEFQFTDGGGKLVFKLGLIDCVFCVAGNQLKTGRVLGIIDGDYVAP